MAATDGPVDLWNAFALPIPSLTKKDLDDLAFALDLGVDYEKGRGVSPDRSRALALYRKACELGFQQGCGRK